MNKILTIALLGIFMLSFTSAFGDIGIVKQGNCIELYNYCPTCTYINLTAISFPDGSLNSTINEAMNKTGYIYTSEFCDTERIGKYSYTTCGDKLGEDQCEDITFTSTASGRDGNNNIALVIILIVMIYAITFISFFGRNLPLSTLTGMMMMFFGVWIIRNGIVIYRDNLTNYFGYVTIFVGVAVALIATVEWIQDTF